MADSFDRLKTALADRYAIQEELGAGGIWMKIEYRILKIQQGMSNSKCPPSLQYSLFNIRYSIFN